jgi:hypothetical protein
VQVVDPVMVPGSCNQENVAEEVYDNFNVTPV